MQHEDYKPTADDREALLKALQDVREGRVQSLEEFDQEFRAKNNIEPAEPKDQEQ